MAMVELQVWPGESHDRPAFRRDRGSRDHRVAGSLRQFGEDVVEIVTRIGERPQFERESPAHRAHQFDVEPGCDPLFHDVEGWIGISRQDR
jgi:hypothetical protein